MYLRGSMLRLTMILLALTAAVAGSEASSVSGGAYRRHFDRGEHVLRRMSSLDFSSKISSSSPSSRVFYVTDYGADPTGNADSTDAILRAIADAYNVTTTSGRALIHGVPNLGGAELHLAGGEYLIKAPLRLPAAGAGNFKIHGGSLRASDDFPSNRYLIELWASPSTPSSGEQKSSSTNSYDYEYITIKDVMLDSNFRGGGLAVVNALRTTVENVYAVHFTTDGVRVTDGHETYIHDSFIGQHITAGNDPGEKSFTGTGINLNGNDNAVTDVVIFSAETGILISGQANSISGVHCYNKATAWGGTGIYVKSPGLTQTRIINSYLDFTSIVAEDPVQLLITSSFFLGDANVVLKSVKGIAKGVNIVDNMFSGRGGGVETVSLDESKGKFTAVEEVVVERNIVQGMTARSTVARTTVEGNSSRWAADFSKVLLFPDKIEHVQYTMRADGSFPSHTLRNVNGNTVVIESDVAVTASVDVTVHQCAG